MEDNPLIPPLREDTPAAMTQRAEYAADQTRRMDAQLREAQRAAEGAASAIREVRETLAGLSFPFSSSVLLSEEDDG